MELSSSFLQHFEDIKDPRLSNHNKRHELQDILTITILGAICGADNWVEISEFGRSKESWLSTFLQLPHGIPSHDTFGRVFGLLDCHQFDMCFNHWIESLSIDVNKEVIAIDGKTLRGSGNRRQNKSPIHMVSAWASKQGLLLGQLQTCEKSNEITAIPQLLKMVDITGSVVTIDAMGCQTSIAQEIQDQGADYVLNLKENHPKFYETVKAIFHMGEHRQYKKMLHRRKVEKVHDHGRKETRRYTLVSARDQSVFQVRWPGLKGIGKLEVTRTTNNHVERSTRYFLSSLSYEDIDLFMKSVRHHWHIEIGLHWSLDVSFKEDLNQTHVGNSARNLGTVRRIALNLLRQAKTNKCGILCRRKKAGWDNQFLLKVLMADHKLLKRGS